MPLSAASICPEPGCSKIVRPAGPCKAHRAARSQERGSSAARGYDRRHRRWRLYVLRADPVCHYPDKVVRVGSKRVAIDGTVRVVTVYREAPGSGVCRKEATHADHIVPLSWGGPRRDVSNGQGLCHACHNDKSRREGLGEIVITRGR